ARGASKSKAHKDRGEREWCRTAVHGQWARNPPACHSQGQAGVIPSSMLRERHILRARPARGAKLPPFCVSAHFGETGPLLISGSFRCCAFQRIAMVMRLRPEG